MSIWQDIKCGIFGHAWVVGDHMTDIGAERNCERCGAHVDAIVWPKHDLSRPIPFDSETCTWPGKAAGMPMPDIIWPSDKPAPVESTEQQILAELKAIRAALEAQSKPVQYEIKNAVSSQASQSQIAAAARGADRSRRNN